MMEFGEGFFLHLDLVPTTAMLVKYPLEKQQINEETKLSYESKGITKSPEKLSNLVREIEIPDVTHK